MRTVFVKHANILILITISKVHLKTQGDVALAKQLMGAWLEVLRRDQPSPAANSVQIHKCKQTGLT